MKKEEIKEQLKKAEESYKQIEEQITQLTQNKYRLEGQYSVLKKLLEDGEEVEDVEEGNIEELEEIGD